MKLQCGSRELDCSTPKIMAILNVTPDSFYDGGALYQDGRLSLDRVLRKADEQVAEGADLIDVGGESTRPGALPVSVAEELERVVPAVEALVERFDVVVSVDTSRAPVIAAAAKEGAGLINDVRALTEPQALQAAAASGLAVCLMHMQGTPQTMQCNPKYSNALAAVLEFLLSRRDQCVQAGIEQKNILLDPGIGFGKTDEHNLELLCRLEEFASVAPLLLGVSRKSLFGRILGRPLEQRLAGSLAVAFHACQKGVSILRVHDVAATKDVVSMWQHLH